MGLWLLWPAPRGSEHETIHIEPTDVELEDWLLQIADDVEPLLAESQCKLDINVDPKFASCPGTVEPSP